MGLYLLENYTQSPRSKSYTSVWDPCTLEYTADAQRQGSPRLPLLCVANAWQTANRAVLRPSAEIHCEFQGHNRQELIVGFPPPPTYHIIPENLVNPPRPKPHYLFILYNPALFGPLRTKFYTRFAISRIQCTANNRPTLPTTLDP